MNLETAGPSPNPFTYIRPISEPQRFVGRRDETREIFSLLGAADFGSCSIVGARRSGKTSLLNFISHPDTIRQHGLDPETCLFIHLDLSTFTSSSTPAQFYEYMLKHIATRVQSDGLAEQIKDAVSQESISSFDLDELFDTVDSLGLRIVALLDEFQNVGNNSNYGLDFLYGLRSLATHHGLALVTSTRGDLVSLARSEQMRSSPWFNIFTNIVLRPFSQADIEEMLEKYLPGTGVTFSQTEVSHVLALTGTLPFLVHMGFELLYEEWQRDPEEASRLGSLEARFHEAATPHLESSWRHSLERHKTILSLLTLLAGQQDGQRTYWKWEQLESWYVNVQAVLEELDDQGPVVRGHDRYALASSSVYRWIDRELAHPTEETEVGRDDHIYESRLNISLPKQSAARTISWLRHTNTKYRSLFARWMCDPRTSDSVFDLLNSSTTSFKAAVPLAAAEVPREQEQRTVEVARHLGESRPPESLELQEPSQSRGQLVSILFTDLEGSTEQLNRLGDEENQELMRVHNNLVRELVAQHRGTEVKTMGDGFMIAFPHPLDAANCAIDIQRRLQQYNTEQPDRPLRVRIGINAGEAIQEGGDLFGNAVVLASRIMALASGGQILVSDLFRKLTDGGSDIECVDRGWRRLKGFAVRQHIYEVPWSADQP